MLQESILQSKYANRNSIPATRYFSFREMIIRNIKRITFLVKFKDMGYIRVMCFGDRNSSCHPIFCNDLKGNKYESSNFSRRIRYSYQ